jgi:hypothetical protein
MVWQFGQTARRPVLTATRRSAGGLPVPKSAGKFFKVHASTMTPSSMGFTASAQARRRIPMWPWSPAVPAVVLRALPNLVQTALTLRRAGAILPRGGRRLVSQRRIGTVSVAIRNSMSARATRSSQSPED